MSADLRGRVSIVGVGLAGCGEASGFSDLDLAAEAARRAVADAGLSMRDIDGLVTTVSRPICLFFRSRSIWVFNPASSMELESEVRLSLRISSQPRWPWKWGCAMPFWSLMAAPPGLAVIAQCMHLYGTTREQLAKVAVDARAWAGLNPAAFSRDPLTIDEVLGSRMVSDPLTVRDCCLVTDGAGAFVLVPSERARDISDIR